MTSISWECPSFGPPRDWKKSDQNYITWTICLAIPNSISRGHSTLLSISPLLVLSRAYRWLSPRTTLLAQLVVGQGDPECAIIQFPMRNHNPWMQDINLCGQTYSAVCIVSMSMLRSDVLRGKPHCTGKGCIILVCRPNVQMPSRQPDSRVTFHWGPDSIICGYIMYWLVEHTPRSAAHLLQQLNNNSSTTRSIDRPTAIKLN